MMKAAFHVARTGRCGPVLVDIAADVQEAELDFAYPDEVDLPGLEAAARRCTRGRSARRRSAIAEARAARSSTSAAASLNADACAELLELAEAGAPARS